MKRISVAAVFMAVLAFSGAAHAQAPQSAWYIGGSLGEGEWKNWCDGVTGNCDKKDSTWRFFGGYRLNRSLAVELGYAELGDVSISGPLGNASGEANAWDLVGILGLPLGPFSIYGKLGAYYGEVDASSTVAAFGFSSTGSASESNSDITYGVGVQFDFARGFSVRGEWQRYEGFGGSGVGGETDMDVYSLGVLYRF